MEGPHQYSVQRENRKTQTHGAQPQMQTNHPRDALAEEMEPHHQLEEKHDDVTQKPPCNRNYLSTSTISCMLARH